MAASANLCDTCPLCGRPGEVGFSGFACCNPDCDNFSEQLASENSVDLDPDSDDDWNPAWYAWSPDRDGWPSG